MASDAAKHVIPAGSDAFPRRQQILDLSLSIHDVIPVANATERGTVYSAMVAAGRDPATAPVMVRRLDTGAIESSSDGTTWLAHTGPGTSAAITPGSGWQPLTGFLPPAAHLTPDGIVTLEGFTQRSGATITSAASGVIGTIPAGWRPAGTIYVPLVRDGGVVAVITISTGGVIQCEFPMTWTQTSAFLSLDGVTYRAA